MATVWIPSIAAGMAGGHTRLEVEGGTVLEVVRNLCAAHPGLEDTLLEGGLLRPGILLAVDGAIGSRDALQPVGPDSEIHFVPAIFAG